MSDWLDALARLAAAATPHVLVTVVEAKGSAPREAGAKMVLTADAQHGSIGGGALEHTVTALARRLLAAGATAPTIESFPLGPALGADAAARLAPGVGCFSALWERLSL